MSVRRSRGVRQIALKLIQDKQRMNKAAARTKGFSLEYWLVLMIPLFTVIAGAVTIWIASHHGYTALGRSVQVVSG